MTSLAAKCRPKGGVHFRHAWHVHLTRQRVYLPSFPEPQKKKKKTTVPSSTVLIFQILILGISASGLRRCWYSSACLCLLKI